MSLTSAEVAPDWLDVSRETLERLREFCDLVRKWSPAINLVSRADLGQLWQRHLLDSAQLFDHAPKDARRWADLGSGGGFPGIVIAILAQAKHRALDLHLVESDLRKATFLAQAARILSLNVTLHRSRIDDLAPLQADVLTARALAPLPVLCAHAHRHLAATGLALFPKGEGVEAELLACQGTWQMAVVREPSRTRPDGVILKIRDLRHV